MNEADARRALTWSEILALLEAPINYEIKPKKVFQQRDGTFTALALGYISREHVQRRLDEVMTSGNWKVEFVTVDPSSKVVECRLSLRLYEGFDWVTKADVGAPQGDDAGVQWKAAYSDAFKRAATQWGIGRFLYDLPKDYRPCEAEKGKREGEWRFKKWIESPSKSTAKNPTVAAKPPTEKVEAVKPENPRPLAGAVSEAVAGAGSKSEPPKKMVSRAEVMEKFKLEAVKEFGVWDPEGDDLHARAGARLIRETFSVDSFEAVIALSDGEFFQRLGRYPAALAATKDWHQKGLEQEAPF